MHDFSTRLDDSEFIDSSIVKNIQEAIQAYQFTYQCLSSPATSIIEETIESVSQSKDSADIAAVLNSPTSDDNEPVQSIVQETELLGMLQK